MQTLFVQYKDTIVFHPLRWVDVRITVELACYLSLCHCLATAPMNILPLAYTETLDMVWDTEAMCPKEGLATRVVLSHKHTHLYTDKIAS